MQTTYSSRRLSRRLETTSRVFAFVMAFTILTPLFAAVRPASAQIFHRNNGDPSQPKQGMSTGKKVLLLGGAALLYYLWRKHQANQATQAKQAAAAGATTSGAGAAANGHPQLYRSKNGGIYYRDPNGKPVWLTVPNQPVQVPAAEVAQYAPDWQHYRGPAPAAPSGYRTQSFGDYDTNLMSSGNGGSNSNGSTYPSGPGGPGRN